VAVGQLPRSRVEAQVRDQPGALEQPHRTSFGSIDDDRVSWLAVKQKGDKAVVAG
jgi:hypothetical protein